MCARHCSSPELRTLWPTGQIQPTIPIYPACKVRMIFTFLKGWKKSKGSDYFTSCGKSYEIQNSGSINKVLLEHKTYYWLLRPYTSAELHSCHRDHVIHKAKNIYYPALCRKSLLIPALDPGDSQSPCSHGAGGGTQMINTVDKSTLSHVAAHMYHLMQEKTKTTFLHGLYNPLFIALIF